VEDIMELSFEHSGAELYAIDAGRGPAIILLHGGLATHRACWAWCDELAARFRVVTPDLRGSGRSVFAGALSWDVLADDVAALAAWLGIERAVVGGISFGAGVALRVALRHPQLVRALALVWPAYGGGALGLAPAQRAAMDAMDAAAQRAVTGAGVAALFPLLDVLPAEARVRGRAMMARYDVASMAASTRFMASGAQPFERGDELAALTMPALVVPGIDPQHPIAVADALARHLPRATTRSVDLAAMAAAIAELAGS
jgi:pimeloyl-ACP methyl ester carboxylesterase